jgi:hypothetical protein
MRRANLKIKEIKKNIGVKEMKHRIILPIALTMTVVLLSLMSSNSSVNAEPPQRFTFDTGVIMLGPNQVLRVAVVGALDLNDLYLIRLNRQSFTQGVCSDGVCKLAVASQTTSDPISLMPGEAVSFEIWGNELPHGVRGVVLSNSRSLRVNALIIDALTGEVTSQIIIANTEGDIH